MINEYNKHWLALGVRLLNVALRAVTLLSKFLLIFSLAKLIEPSEVGLYGLIAAAIGYALYLLGFDFYTYTTRELIRSPRSEWGCLLRDQLALFGLLYFAVLPLSLLIFANGLLPWAYAGWFLMLVVLEHLAQELGRLLIAMSEQLIASLVLFLRSGIWAIAATVVMAMEPTLRSLELVLSSWALGGALALSLGALRLYRKGMFSWRGSVRWSWIKVGLKIAIPLLVGTLAIRAVFTLDRFWFEHLVGLDALGAYVLFIGMCAALMSFLDAGVYSFSYPSLIAAWHNQDPVEFKRQYRRLFVLTASVTLGFGLISLILIGHITDWLGRDVYKENVHIFPWLLLALVLNALGMVPHYGLYAQGNDRAIVATHIGGVLIFASAVLVLGEATPNLAVPLGLCITFLMILLGKTWLFRKSTPALFRHAMKAV